MHIGHLALQHFKNYREINLEFSDHINVLTGLNGMGKTNLLDAIHYLAFTKSAMTSPDTSNIQSNELYLRIQGTFFGESKFEVQCYLDRQKKSIRIDGQDYEKFSDHIGKIGLVLATPYDIDLIRDSSDTRRKWMDGCIAQYNHDYLDALIHYQRTLRQRNQLLKQIHNRLSRELTLLDTYDEQLISLSLNLAQGRKDFTQKILPYFGECLNEIASHEISTMTYRSHALNADFEERFRQERNHDLAAQRTHIGAHRDDIIFTLDGQPIRKFGSQGQQKSFLLALRLAQHDFLQDVRGEKPILLLDDLFDKLDDERIERIANLLTARNRFGQVFISDARPERTKQFFDQVNDRKVFEIANGQIQSS